MTYEEPLTEQQEPVQQRQEESFTSRQSSILQDPSLDRTPEEQREWLHNYAALAVEDARKHPSLLTLAIAKAALNVSAQAEREARELQQQQQSEEP